jgi:hypothetical protein
MGCKNCLTRADADLAAKRKLPDAVINSSRNMAFGFQLTCIDDVTLEMVPTRSVSLALRIHFTKLAYHIPFKAEWQIYIPFALTISN